MSSRQENSGNNITGDFTANLAANLTGDTANESVAAQLPAGWLAQNVCPLLNAACSALAIAFYREALRILILARQFGC